MSNLNTFRKGRRARAIATAVSAAILAGNLSGGAARAADYTWDVAPGTVGAGNGAVNGGTGTWDTAIGNWTLDGGANNVAYTNSLAFADTATFTAAASAATVTLDAPVFAGSVTFGSGNYTIAGTSPNILTLGGATPTIAVTNAGDSAAISAIVAGAAGVTKSGAGTLTLSGVNTFTGGLTVAGGTVAWAGADTNLGAGGVTLGNGATLSYTSTSTTALTLSASRVITVAAGNTATLQTAGTGAITTNGKITAGTANTLAVAGTLVKLGGGDLQISAAQNMTGTFVVGGGVEASNAGAFGTAAVQLQKGGELVNGNGITLANALTVTTNGTGADPILSAIGGNTGVYAGAIAVNGPLTVGLRDFNTPANGRNYTISGGLSGSGTITLVGPTTVGGQTLFLTGDNAAGGYNGTVNVAAGLNVGFAAANSLGAAAVVVNASATAMGGVGFGYDFGGAVPAFTNTRTGTTTGGVFGVNTALAAGTTLNLATLGGGGMFLGSQTAGTYAAPTLGADAGTYRLGGGTGTLTIAAGALAGANDLVAGDARANGTGTVVLAGNNSYTGTTTVAGGTLQVGAGGTTGSLGGTTGTITVNGTLAFNRSDNVTLSNALTGTGRLQQSAASTLTLGGAASAIGGLTLNANGVINIGASNLGLSNGNLVNGAGGTINSGGGQILLNVANGDIGVGNGGTITINAVIANGSQNSVDFFNVANGTGVVVLTAANTYTGASNLQTGVVSVSSIGSTGNPGGLGVNGAINLGNGTNTGVTLRYTGTGETSDRVVNLSATTGAAIIDQSGTGLLKFTSNFAATGAGIKVLTLTGSTAGTGEISGAIANNTATNTTGVTKTGTGTWTLSGANTYTGPTLVQAGTLNVTGSLAATPITVSTGATLNFVQPAGTSQAIGAISFAAGETSVVSTYGGSGTTTLTAPSVARTAGAVGNLVTLGGVNGSTNKIVISGLGTTPGLVNFGVFYGTGTSGLGNTYAYNDAGGFVRGINYGADPTTQLVTATTASLSSAAGANARTTSSVTAQATDAFVTLNLAGADPVAANNSLTLAAGATLTVSSVLKSGGSAATIGGGTAVSTTSGGDYVFRVDAASDTLTVATPIVANGANALSKSGAGTLSLTAINTFTGAINVTGGTLSYTGQGNADPTYLGAGAKAITLYNGATLAPLTSSDPSANTKTVVIGTGGGTFNVANGVSLTLNDGSQFSGAGDLTVVGAGTGAVVIGQASTGYTGFTGNVSVNSATLRLVNGTAVGNTAGRTITVAAGAVLDLQAATIVQNLVLNGSGISGGGAMIDSSTTVAGAASGSVTLATDASVGGAGTLTFTGPVGGAGKLTKVGAGTVVLSGPNAWTGGTLVSAGTLQFNAAASVPATGSISVPAPGVVAVNNFSTADVAAALARVAPGSTGVFALAGTSGAADADFAAQPNLFLGASGAVTYTGTYTPPATKTVNLGGGGGTLAFNQVLASAAVTDVNIGATGTTGTVVLGGTNTYAGTTTVNAGATLSVAADANLGGPTAGLAISGGTLTVTGTANTALGGGRALSLPGAATINVADANNTYAVNQSAAAGGAITKTGPGALTLGGTITTATNVVVSAGTLNLTGTVTGSSTATTLAQGNTAGTTVVNVSGNFAGFAVAGANVAGSVAVYNQTAGTVTVSPGTGDSQFVAKTGYGYFNLTGGTYRDVNRFDVAANNAAAVGVAYIGGTGTLNNNLGEWMIVGYGGLGQMTVGPGGTVTRTGAGSPLGVALTSNSYGVLNVAGGTVDAGTAALRVSNSTSAVTSNITGFVNVAGGTLAVGTIGSNATFAGSSGNNYYAFAGGTLKANAALATGFAPASANGVNVTTTIYGPINNAAATGNASQNFAGGMVVDTNGFDVTLPNTLNGAVGTSGVAQTSLSVTGGTGYVGAPAVQFTGGTVAPGGSPAAGYALIGGGAVTGIVITNPGAYTAAPTAVTLTGGGGTGAAVALGALAANTAGGVTKVGAGTLTLSGANTYTGTTLVTAGTLALTGSIAGSNVNVNGPSAAFTQSAAGVIGGAGATFTVTSGSANLAGANTYTGATTVAGGSLVVSGAGTLATSGLSVAGGATFGYQPTAPGTLTVPTFALADGSKINSSFGGTLAATGAATTAGTVFLIPTGPYTSGTPYTLLTAAGGLNAATYTVNNATDYTYTLAVSPTAVTVTPTQVTALAAAYWKGGFAGAPAVWSASNGSTASNWTTDAAGTTATGLVPGGTTDVTFAATGATNLTGITLGANVAANSVTFATAAPVTVAADPFALTVNGAAGLTVAAAAGAVTLNNNLALGAAQTWTNNSTANPLTVGGAVATNGFALTLATPTGTAINLTGAVGGTGSLVKTGPGTLTLAGANTYSGGTAVQQGGLVVAADQSLPGTLTVGGTAVAGASTTATTTTGTVDLSAASATVGGLTVPTNSTTANTITVGAGRTLTVTGNVAVGVNLGTGVATTNTATSLLTVSGGGSVAFTGTGSTVNVGVAQGTQLGTATTSTLNLSGLTGSFAADVGTFNVGFGQTAGGTLTLTNASNTVRAATLNVGNSNNANGGVGLVTLGTGTNVVNADAIVIGSGKVNGTVQFASQAAGSPGTLVLANRAGNGPAAITVGVTSGANTGATLTGALDLRGHLSTVTAGAVVVANTNNTNTGFASGTIQFDTGTFNAASLSLGQRAAAQTGTATNVATLNVGGGAFAVSGATTFAQYTATGTTTVGVTGIINLSGGSFSTGSIVGASKSGAGASASTATSTVNVTAGATAFTVAGNASMASNTVALAAAGTAGTATATWTASAGTFTIGGTLTGATDGSTLGNAGGASATLNVGGTAAAAIGAINLASKTGSGTEAATGAINVSGGSLSVTGATFVLATQATAGTASGTLNVTGGNVTSAADITDGGGAGATSTVNLNGGSLDLTGHALGSATNGIDSLVFAAGTLANVASINGTGTAAANGVDKTTAGTLALAGVNAYTGPTSVSAGTLLVNGTLPNTSAVSVALGATLGGSSPGIAGPVSVGGGGTLAPGTPGTGVGQMTLTGKAGNTTAMLALAATSTLSIDLTPVATPGTGYDQVVVSGVTGPTAVNLGSATLAVAGATAPNATYVLVDNRTTAATAGTFAGLPEGAVVTVGGNQFAVTYAYDNGPTGTANDVALVPVPEPTSAGALALAAVGLLARRRRRATRR